MPLNRRGYFYAILRVYRKEIIMKTVNGIYTSAKIFNTNSCSSQRNRHRYWLRNDAG